jgi:cell wall-associated NlpC family hydrolase
MALLPAFIALGCTGAKSNIGADALPAVPHPIPLMRYTIQVGAFSNLNNAVRLTDKLRARGISAYHFRHDSGLYKVRFGNYASRNAARSRAEELKAVGVIEEFYLVDPAQFAVHRRTPHNRELIRNEIVKTAKQYIGVPYRWGGESAQTGFDCSGLTMVVYRLNGLDLPRSSRQQWQTGSAIRRSRLAKGDLVFFATSGGRKVSHVGIYVGNGKFIHAPRRGQNIKISSLAGKYYRTRYVGARSYL